MRNALPALFLFAPLLQCNTAMAGESRVALVIGNKDYKRGALVNALNDSRAMRDTLARLGFQVVYRENLKSTEIGSMLQEFRSRIEPGAVALFYYSGHGSQFRGVNYLYSVNDESSNEFELQQQNMTANQVLSVMVEARTRLNVVMLDACRDNPFKTFARGPEDGLARMTGPVGTLISFATHPGALAKDDGPDGHGLYTGFLLKYLASSPNLEIERVFKLVSNEVFKYSRGVQIPWIEGVMLGEDFCFAGCRTSVPASLQQAQIASAAVLDQNVPQPKLEAPSTKAVPSTAQASHAVTNGAGSKPQAQVGGASAVGRTTESKPQVQAAEADGQKPIVTVQRQEQLPGALSTNENDVLRCQQKIFDACERAARAGNKVAQGRLGWHYENGSGVTPDYEQAAIWYRRAAEQGDAFGQVRLGDLYAQGKGVKPSYVTGYFWSRKAADNGDPEGQRTVAAYYNFGGGGVQTNTSQVLYWIHKSIKQGDTEAMADLARYSLWGIGVIAKNIKLANDWYRKCAELGNFECQRELAEGYMKGRGLPKDMSQAIYWLRQAADRGDHIAQCNLGFLYSAEGPEKDMIQAVYWFRKAADQGDGRAPSELQKLGY